MGKTDPDHGRTRRRAAWAALAVVALAGCSRGGPAPVENFVEPVHLSDTDRNANAPAIAAFFNRTCLQAGESATALTAALDGSHWQHDLVQPASSAMPIAGWRLERGELVHSAMALGTGNNFIDCELVLDAEVAPTLERMRDAIRPLLPRVAIREVSAGPPEARWQWLADLRDERALTVGPARPGGRPGPVGLSLHLRITETALVEAPPADANAIEDEAGNVQ